MEAAATTSKPASRADIAARGTGANLQANNNDAGIVQHSNRQQSAPRDCEEPCTTLIVDWESAIANEHMSLDGTAQEESCDSDTPSTWVSLVVEPKSN
jgi:hypothetical protein